MGCTKWSLATFIVLAVAALFFIIGMATNHIVKFGNFSLGLFQNGPSDTDWVAATQAFTVLACMLMAAAVVFYLIMLLCSNKCGRRLMIILQSAGIFAAAACGTLAVVIFGPEATKEGAFRSLDYSYYLLVVGTALMYLSGAFSIIDMIQGDPDYAQH